MNKVIIINLNGNAYSLEERGYEALRAYLDAGARRLEGNPDKDEIIADIEQAIADKFRAGLGAHKTVVVTSDVEQVIAEMGPVEDASSDDQPAGTAAAPAPGGPEGVGSAGTEGAPRAGARRLYKIHDGAMLAGVCNGLAAYLNIDVTIIRLLFVLVTIFGYGSGVLVYLLMTVLLPAASTPAEKAAAFGAPFTAEEFIRRAKAGYYEGMKTFHDKHAHRAWKRNFKREMRGWSRDFKQGMAQNAYQWSQNWHSHWGRYSPPAPAHVFTLSFLSLLSGVVFLLGVAAIICLVSNGTIFGMLLPPRIPLWVGIIFVLIAMKIVRFPLKAARRSLYVPFGYDGRDRSLICVLWNTLCGFAFLFVLVLLADRYVPEAHATLRNLPAPVHQTIDSAQQWCDRHLMSDTSGLRRLDN